MALPVPDKTWQFNVNQALPAQVDLLTTNRRVMRTIKDSMIGFASNPWIVRGSSNSVAAGMDSVDRWTSDSGIVSAVGAHSWIVLRQTGIATNYELCIDFNQSAASVTNVSRIVSPAAGFTGGSITARPTATDEISIPSTTLGWGVISTGNPAYVLHAMQSTDGQVTYLFLIRTGQPGTTLLMGFGRMKNPVPGFSNPSYGFFESAAAGAGSPNCADSSMVSSALTVGPGMLMHFTTEKADNAILTDTITVPNDLSGEYPLFPIGFASITGATKGRHGQIYDMWMGLGSLATGDTYPNDASRQFAHFGTFVVPWNGTVVAL